MDAYVFDALFFLLSLFFPPSFFVLVFHENEARLTRLCCCLRARLPFFLGRLLIHLFRFFQETFFSPAIHPPVGSAFITARTHTHTVLSLAALAATSLVGLPFFFFGRRHLCWMGPLGKEC
jgi:hypothetical protein